MTKRELWLRRQNSLRLARLLERGFFEVGVEAPPRYKPIGDGERTAILCILQEREWRYESRKGSHAEA